jgi:hypothetical protein
MLANRGLRRMCALSLARGVRRRIESLCLVVALTSAAIAQATQYDWADLSVAGVFNGCPMTGIGDIDGDGVPDVLIGEGFDSTLAEYAGRADVVSGRDGSVIRFIYGRATPQAFGTGTARLGDVDGDGVEDFAVGAPYSGVTPINGYVRVISGRTGMMLREFVGPVFGVLFGGLLRPCPDVDGDGVGELLIGAPAATGYLGSVVQIVSPTSGAVLREFHGPLPNYDTGFGWSVDAIGDIDGDGITEIIVGSYWDFDPNHPTVDQPGSARVFSAATGVQLAAYYGSFYQQAFGFSVRGLGDVNSDGVPDFAIGAVGPLSNGQPSSRVDVRSGATGAVLYSITGPNKQTGWLIEPVGDQDADGATDFLISVAEWSPVLHTSLAVVSGRTGAMLTQIVSSPGWAFRFAWSAGDINGDGREDLLVPGYNAPTATNQIHVQLVLIGADAPTTYCTAKTNSLGCVPTISSSGGASLSVGDNFNVSAIHVINNKPGVLLWSASALNAPFAGGTLCVAQASFSVRGPVLDSGGLVPPWNDCSGAYSYHFSHALMTSRGLTAGTTLYAQFISRDNGFAPPRNIGLTDALRFTVVP